VKHRKTPERRWYSLPHRRYRFAIASGALIVAALMTEVAQSPGRHAVPAYDSQILAVTDAARANGNGTSRDRPRTPPSPSHAPSSPVPAPSSPAASSPATSSTPKAAPVTAPSSKVLSYQFQLQVNYYYCGPAAARIAASTRGHVLSQDDLAGRLGTTVNGTNSAEDTTRALNSIDGTTFYRTTSIPGGSATPAAMDRLQADIVHAISNGYAVVANIVGTVTDTAGGWHAYDGGHYLTVVGYQDDGRTAKIADPADVNGDGSYWVTTIQLANWMASRGYSA
jgi:hypothetical protein